MAKQLGVDASHWQGEQGMSGAWLDKLVECGVKWALFKATQSTGFTDRAFDENRRKAEKRGILVGAYHFLERGEGKAKADHLLRTVRATGSVRDIPLVVDVERVPTATTADDPDWRTIKAFLRRIRDKAPRAERWLYSSPGYWRSIGNPDANGLADALWQARWDGERHTCKRPTLPKVPPRAGFAVPVAAIRTKAAGIVAVGPRVVGHRGDPFLCLVVGGVLALGEHPVRYVEGLAHRDVGGDDRDRH